MTGGISKLRIVRKPGTALTDPAHELYARYRAAGKSKAEAYRAAGYTDDRRSAHRLEATNNDIRERIAELQQELIEQEGLTPEWIVKKLMYEAQHAETGAARVSALKSLGQMAEIGLFVERISHENAEPDWAGIIDALCGDGELPRDKVVERLPIPFSMRADLLNPPSGQPEA